MRVLLLQAPVSQVSPHARLSPPLGLAYVAARLLDAGHRVELRDLNLTGLNPARIAAVVDRFGPDLVGISSQTETYPNAVALSRMVKEIDPTVPVVVGGPHATILPLDVLAEDSVDFVVRGEGEMTVLELAAVLESGSDRVAVGAIAGLGHKARGGPELNAAREPLDAADVGLPARQLLSLEFYKDAHNVLVARGGCPYRCPFCSASQLWGGKRRMRPVDHVIEEVREVVRVHGARHVFFVDDILTLNKRWLHELMDRLEEMEGRPSWGCATRVDQVDEALLARMAETGCTGIQFGVESGAQSILDSVKGIDKGRALDAVRWAVGSGIAVSCSFMVPFPEDTEETLSETLEFMRVIRDAGGKLLISYTTPYPGTDFFARADDLGLRILTDDWSLYDAKHFVMETRHFSAGRLEELVTGMADELGLVASM